MRVRTAARTVPRRIVALAAVASTAALLLAWAPPARALEPGGARFATWVGEIHAAGTDGGERYEYSGSACPVEDEVCVEILATYRVLALTAESHAALGDAAGGRAALTGVLLPGHGGGTMGTLVVWEVAGQ